jgi:drug/metabolite transporter (DMT)-like permease
MARKDSLDLTGTTLLIGVTLLLAFNQVIVKWVNEGLQPVFFAGVRSLLAVVFLGAWMWFRGRPPKLERHLIAPGLVMGFLFAVEFLCLFMALDLTTISRTSVIFYSMPVWMALGAHYLLPGEALNPLKLLGLVLAFVGTAIAIYSGATGAQQGQGSLIGDLFALGAAILWAATALLARRPAMAAAGPEVQLFWMILVSGPLLVLAAPLFGPLIRDFQTVHIFWIIFQAAVVVAGGFSIWLWLLASYPAATVASFSFLTPVLGLFLGWLMFGESLTPQILLAGFLVALGIILINRRPSATGRKVNP